MTIEVARERHVPAPIEEVWRVVSRPELASEWFTFAERVEVLDGEGLGQRQRQHGHWGKRAAEVDREIIEYEPPHGYAWRHLAERLDGRPAPVFSARTEFEIRLSEQADGTLVRMHSRQSPATWLRGLVMRAFGTREVAAGMSRSLDRLAERFAAARHD
jgi:uncharacterized protein YndB with AHSA1/START domain